MAESPYLSIEPLREEAAVVARVAPETEVDVEQQVARLLREAQLYIDQDFLTWPEVNATTAISEALRLAPAQPRALELRDTVAARLLIEAQTAYADGFQASALDVLDQVLAFHPEYAPALAQRSQWRRAQ